MNNDLYILTIWKGVDPILTGSYKDAEAREQALISVDVVTARTSPYCDQVPQPYLPLI